MTTFEVWATVWDYLTECQVKKHIGTFDDYVYAKLFSNAFNKRYSLPTEIRTVSKIEVI